MISLLDWFTCELCSETLEPEYCNTGLECKIVLKLALLESKRDGQRDITSEFLLMLVWQSGSVFSPESGSCFSDLLIFLSFLHSTSTCFNETFVITDCSCVLSAGRDGIEFFENRSTKWLHWIGSLRCKMCSTCLPLKIDWNCLSLLASSLTVRRVHYLCPIPLSLSSPLQQFSVMTDSCSHFVLNSSVLTLHLCEV